MENNEFDMEKMLKKALEENKSRTGKKRVKPEEAIDLEKAKNVVGPMMSLLGKGSLIKIGKIAQEKMDKEIENLISELVEHDVKNKSEFRTFACRKIMDTAKTLKVLEIYLMTTGLIGISDEKDYEDAIDMIIKLSN